MAFCHHTRIMTIEHEITIARARAFATAAHAAVGQLRKYSNLPYIVHPVAVAERVKQVEGHTTEMVVAALLHDTVEDTRYFVDESGRRFDGDKAKFLKGGGKLFLVEGITVDLIRREFGNTVGDMVSGLTEASMPWDGNRKERKAKDREHLRAQSSQVKTVKAADILHNLRDILRNDPGFARNYFREKREDLPALDGAEANILAELQQLIDAYFLQHA
jgi:(p)ppGpp synthase/HD superfamily hydrolase